MLTQSEKQALHDVSSSLGITPKKLSALIQFESKWNPGAENKISHAKGLIQFMPETAKKMGYANQYDLFNKNPTIEKQLRGPVYNYLKNYKPFTSDQSLFMAVFYPKARYWSPYQLFPENVRASNPGINRPVDYVRKVYNASILPNLSPLLIFIGIAGMFLIVENQKRKGKYATTENQGA